MWQRTVDGLLNGRVARSKTRISSAIQSTIHISFPRSGFLFFIWELARTYVFDHVRVLSEKERKKGQELNSFSFSLSLTCPAGTKKEKVIRACERKEKRKVEFLSRRNTQAGTVMKFTAWGFYVFSFSFIFWSRRNRSLSIHWRRDTRKYKDKGKGARA